MGAYERIVQPIKAELGKVERQLKRLLSDDMKYLSPAAKFLMESGGKRLRPAMVLLSAKACGASCSPKLIAYATSVELIHMGTLVFDDFLDGSRLRRGRETINSRWGERISILLGFQFFLKVINLFKGEDRLVRELMVDTANTILRGEVGQLSNRGNLAIDEKSYLEIISKKSATFVSACCTMGGMGNGTPQENLHLLKKYGLHVGIAFQIQDDVLDFIADEKKLGKKIGSDLCERRVTLPIIHCLRVAGPKDRKVVERIYLNGSGDRKAALREINDVLERNGSFSYCRDRARQFGKKAIKNITKLPPSDARNALEELCDFVIERSY